MKKSEGLQKLIEYEVKQGDTLNKIAFHHHVSAKMLQQLNPTITDTIYVGDILMIPVTEQKQKLIKPISTKAPSTLA